MSLINDALKKAQTLQTRPTGANSTFPRATTPGEPANTPANALEPPGGAKLTPPAPSLRPRTKSSQAGVVIAIASLVLVVGLGAIGYVAYALFFAPTPADQLEQAARPAPAAEAPAATPATPVPTATTPAPTPTADTAAAPAATAAPVPSAPVPATASTAQPAATPAPTSAPASADAATPTSEPAPEAVIAEEEETEPEVVERYNNPDPKIAAWVDRITVTGIRGGDRPKALMNDRVYLEGDIVNHEFALRLSKVDTRVLTFEDAAGNTYEYHF
jgi:hypothetical protein